MLEMTNKGLSTPFRVVVLIAIGLTTAVIVISLLGGGFENLEETSELIGNFTE